eukprot:Opistho-1_new@108518
MEPGSPGNRGKADAGRQARLDRIRQSMDEFKRSSVEMSTPGATVSTPPVAARDGLVRTASAGRRPTDAAQPRTLSPEGASDFPLLSSPVGSAPTTPVKMGVFAAPALALSTAGYSPSRVETESKDTKHASQHGREKSKSKGKKADAADPPPRDPAIPHTPPDFTRVLRSLSGDKGAERDLVSSPECAPAATYSPFGKHSTVIRHDQVKERPSARLAVTMPAAAAAGGSTVGPSAAPPSPPSDEGEGGAVVAEGGQVTHTMAGIVGLPVNPAGASDPLSPASIEKSAVAKFYLEQHFENVMKSYTERIRRREQLEAEMARMDLTPQQKDQLRAILRQKESEYIRLKRVKMDKSMFQPVKTIGVGAFGEVVLVRKVDTQHLYAMKVLRKADVLRRNQIAHVKAERDILAEADNEWVVKLFYSFQDPERLYFVMEYVPGGDMMTLLIRLGTFPEAMCRFYIAELTLAIESVHKMGFSHRDIKPDNILIDKDGHIKLTDFGLSTGFRWTHDSQYYQELTQQQQQQQESLQLELQRAQQNGSDPREIRRLQRTMAHSLVGTPNYIAPEVLQGTGYTKACDWWSMGIIMFEMLFGHPPFFSQTPSETKRKVLNWRQHLRMPPDAGVSAAARDMVLSLCCAPEERLGSQGADEIKRHPFFAAVNWSVNMRRQETPYIPSIRFDGDTSNFDDIASQPLGTGTAPAADRSSNPHAKHAFIEFTFRRFWNLTRRPSNSYSVDSRRKDNRKSAFF